MVSGNVAEEGRKVSKMGKSVTLAQDSSQWPSHPSEDYEDDEPEDNEGEQLVDEYIHDLVETLQNNTQVEKSFSIKSHISFEQWLSRQHQELEEWHHPTYSTKTWLPRFYSDVVEGNMTLEAGNFMTFLYGAEFDKDNLEKGLFCSNFLIRVLCFIFTEKSSTSKNEPSPSTIGRPSIAVVAKRKEVMPEMIA
ncbi:hypothetical protein BDY19DRAFT_908266 [Irpex rosettiformis]|uniref:Uncharacterized protein n=1 Tax=Irpex rosettiformis TaxID=378272 RepID=A0ACB8TX58_9APHY|nr:hypothetical protein BDY19DRAFT_908266 [Irpex rosettiformis]